MYNVLDYKFGFPICYAKKPGGCNPWDLQAYTSNSENASDADHLPQQHADQISEAGSGAAD